MRTRSVHARLAVALCASLPILAIPGCSSPGGEAGAKGAAPPPPDVTVARPIVREDYQDILEFTGRIEAMETVEIRARVQGFLEKINFKEGEEVKKGDLLYVIEQLPYKTDLAKSEADIQRQDAALARATADLARANGLRQRNAIPQADYDAAVASRDEAKAQLESLKASREQAKIQLDYTEIRAPIDGRISRTQVTKGNLVGFSQPTLLTTIVRADRMYVYFDPDERGLLAYQKLVREGKAQSAAQGISEAQVVLSSGDAFTATIDFSDNQVDPQTGTIAVRGVMENPKPAGNSERPLTPGLFCRVRIPVGRPHRAIFVADRAIQLDLANKFVWTVGEDGKTAYRKVQVGSLVDGLRVIESGLEASERVVVNGIMAIRGPGQAVNAQEGPMPAGPATPAAPAPGGDAKAGPKGEEPAKAETPAGEPAKGEPAKADAASKKGA